MNRVTSPKKKKVTRKVARKAASPGPRRRRDDAVVDYDLVLFISGASRGIAAVVGAASCVAARARGNTVSVDVGHHQTVGLLSGYV